MNSKRAFTAVVFLGQPFYKYKPTDFSSRLVYRCIPIQVMHCEIIQCIGLHVVKACRLALFRWKYDLQPS